MCPRGKRADIFKRRWRGHVESRRVERGVTPTSLTHPHPPLPTLSHPYPPSPILAHMLSPHPHPQSNPNFSPIHILNPHPTSPILTHILSPHPPYHPSSPTPSHTPPSLPPPLQGSVRWDLSGAQQRSLSFQEKCCQGCCFFPLLFFYTSPKASDGCGRPTLPVEF